MKLPQVIESRHKLRDAKIISLFLNENLTLAEIGSRYNLTASRIQQILSTNSQLIQWNRDYEKAIRVNALKRMAKRFPEEIGKKSSIDIQEQIRKELEGDKPLIDNRISNVIIQIKEIDASDARTRNRIASGAIQGSPE